MTIRAREEIYVLHISESLSSFIECSENMKPPVIELRVLAWGELPVGETLKAEEIKYNKKELESGKIEIKLPMEMLLEWQQTINKIVKRWNMEKRK